MGNILLTNGQSIPEDSIIFKVSAPIDNGIETKIPISLVQYDTSFAVIGFSILYKNSIMKLDNSYTISIRMKKPDGKEVYDQVIGFDQNNTVYILVTQQMTTAFGEGEICLELINGNNKKSTKSVPVYISENPVSEKNIESTDEYKTIVEIAAEVQQAAQLVQSQATNLQNVTNNLDAIKNAASNATAAQNAAEEAKVAAQQALGFRTFFSAVSPDENGDLDPSRPMNTPTAQASWTIKSKGDRIQSVQVNGFTTQAGAGDPSPTNVREISTAGMRMVEVMFDGSLDENWQMFATGSGETPLLALPSALMYNTQTPTIFADRYRQASIEATNTLEGISGWYQYLYLRDSSIKDVPSLRAVLQKNPLLVWYIPLTDESKATGLYIPIQVQGHEYRCKMLKLAEGLDAGDNVQSNVPIPCDKRVVLDGTQSLSQGNTASGWYQVFYNPGDSAKVPNGDDVFAYSEWLPAFPINYTFQKKLSGIGLRVDGLISLSFSLSDYPTCNSVEGVKTYLKDHPLTVWYRSTAYTEENDIPVALETHQKSVLVLDGNESFMSAGTVGSLGFYCFLDLANANTGGIQKEAICSHLKNSKTPFFAEQADTHVNQFCIGEANTPRFMFSHSALGTSTSSSATDCIRAVRSYLSAQYAAGTPIVIVYKIATPAIYAHDPVTLVAVPYTDSDVTAANQLAATPSTLPYIDSADVPMLLDDTAQPMALAAPLAPALPVASTYVVSSQDGTTVLVSLKAMQDGGDAKTLEGMTIADINNNTTALLNDYIKIYQARGVAVNVPTGQDATTAVANISSFDGYTPIAVLSAYTLNYGIVCAANYSVIANKAQVRLFNMTDTAQSNVWVYATILYIKT